MGGAGLWIVYDMYVYIKLEEFVVLTVMSSASCS